MKDATRFARGSGSASLPAGLWPRRSEQGRPGLRAPGLGSLGLGLGLALVLLAPSPARAVPISVPTCMVIPGLFCAGSGDIGAAASTISTTLMDTVRGVTDTITAKLGEATTAVEDVKNVLTGSIVKQTEAVGRMQDASQMEETKRAIGEEAVELSQEYDRESAIAHCEGGTGTIMIGEGGDRLEKADCGPPPSTGYTTLSKRGGVGATEWAVVRVVGNADPVSKDGSDAYLNARFNRFASAYCDPTGFDGTLDPALCDAKGDRFVNADIRFGDTLFNSMTLGGDTEAGEANDHLQAVDDLILNLVAPTVPDPLSGTLGATPSGRAETMARRSDMAQASVSATVFASMKELRTPTVDREAQQDDDKDWFTKIANPSVEFPKKVSQYQIFDLLMYRRYAKPDWWQKISKFDDASTVREMINMQAMNHMLSWKQFQIIEMIVAQNAAGFGRGNITPDAGVTALED